MLKLILLEPCSIISDSISIDFNTDLNGIQHRRLFRCMVYSANYWNIVVDGQKSQPITVRYLSDLYWWSSHWCAMVSYVHNSTHRWLRLRTPALGILYRRSAHASVRRACCVYVWERSYVTAVDKLCSSVSNKSSFNSPFVQFINYTRRLLYLHTHTHTQSQQFAHPQRSFCSYFATPQNSTIR